MSQCVIVITPHLRNYKNIVQNQEKMLNFNFNKRMDAKQELFMVKREKENKTEKMNNFFLLILILIRFQNKNIIQH